MRPRKLRRTLALIGLGGMIVAGSITHAAASDAQTAVMAGSFGAAPNYRTLDVCPCERLRYNTFPLSNRSATRAITRWADTITVQAAKPEQPRLVAFSLSAAGALDWIEQNPQQAKRVEVWLLGSLNTVGNGNRGRTRTDEQVLPDGDWSNISTVVVQYDIVADAPADRSNWLAVWNASLRVHMRGYDNLDLNNPDAVWVDPATGARTLYYRTDVLPILAWRQWFTPDERMAELDAFYRPRIEAAYSRPVDLEPKPQAQEVVSSNSKSRQPVLELQANEVESWLTSETTSRSLSDAAGAEPEQRLTSWESSPETASTSPRLRLSEPDRRESRREARTERRNR